MVPGEVQLKTELSFTLEMLLMIATPKNHQVRVNKKDYLHELKMKMGMIRDDPGMCKNCEKDIYVFIKVI